MVKILLKKQMLEAFRGYFYDAKKNKKRPLVSTILFIVLYAFVMVVILGGAFVGLGFCLCGPLNAEGMSWLYFAIMSLIAVALGTFGSVFNSYAALYLSKDNSLLLSMPIPVKDILLSRLAGVYLMGLMFSAVVMVPTVAVYWIVTPVRAAAIVGGIVLVVLVSFFVLFLSCVLGWCVAKISAHLKNKSMITAILSLAFLGLYYFGYFKAQGLIQALLLNVTGYGEKIKSVAYPVYWFGRIGEGNLISMITFILVIGGLCGVTFYILAKSFLGIATVGDKTVKTTYKRKRLKKSGVALALLKKEFGRFISSATYMLNCGMGTLLLVIVGVLILIKGPVIRDMLCEVMGMGVAAKAVAVAFLVIGTLITMNDMATPSISLEAKNLWLIQSLPVTPWQVLRAKASVHVLLTAIPAVFCGIGLIIVFPCTFGEAVLGLLFLVVFTIFMALFGLIVGLLFPNLTWTNELAPIKQNISVLIPIAGGWILIALMIALYLLGGWIIGNTLFLLFLNIVFVGGSAAFYMVLKHWGCNKLRFL